MTLRNTRLWTGVALGVMFATMAIGCGTTKEADSTVSPIFENSGPEEKDASSVAEDEVNSGQDLVTDHDDATELIDFDAIEEKMLSVLGDQTAISRSSSDLNAREFRVERDKESGGFYGENCLDAEEAAIDFTTDSAQHMTAIVSEDESLTPSNPPNVEWVIVEAFSTIEDAQTANNLDVTATKACGGDDAQLDETQRSIDGTVVSIVNEIMGEGLLEQPYISSQEVRIQDGTVLYTYRYQPDPMAGLEGKDHSLSDGELFESAGKRLIAITEG